MNRETLNQHREKLEAIAEMLGRKLEVCEDADNHSASYVPVILRSADQSQPSIHIDARTYGANKGRGVASLLLPIDCWGHAVKPASGEWDAETSFDFGRDARAISKQLHKLAGSALYAQALAEIAKREKSHEARVSAGAELAAAMKELGISFTESRRNGEKPDHTGWTEISYHIDGFGSVYVTYGGGYELKPHTMSAPAKDIAKAINILC